MINYQEGKIYKIVCNITGLVYIGSTCKQYLSQRLQHHKTAYNSYLKTNKHFTSSFKILENGNYDILLLESFPCNTKEELHARERHYIETVECVNLQIVGRTYKEWQDDNKDKIKGYHKTYYTKHNEIVKERAIEYYEKNKEIVTEKHRQYREKHKEELRAKKSTSILCDCGIYYTHNHKRRHERTKKHQTFINQPMNGQQ